MTDRLWTIGYEGRSLDLFLAALKRAGIERLIDVRARASSRLAGFSKRGLDAALANEGIEYLHLPAAGNPYRDLKADIERCLRLYAEHVARHPEMTTALEHAIGSHTALMCFEANPMHCHRSVLSTRWSAARPDRSVVHLEAEIARRLSPR
ncbi:hypothetical protein BH09MYX1_BH09MYX1_00320 [soil metagenome]